MNNKQKETGPETPLKINISEELRSSFSEIWDGALEEVENKKIEETVKFINELKEEEHLKKEYIKKYGKEPEARTLDGKVNKKYIEYVLRRDFGIEPDADYHDSYENFSWGGLTGEEAFIAYWNCD
jgi:hypothetical protein